MPKCFICGAEVCWDDGFSFEEYGMDGDGIVSVWHCGNCKAEYEVMKKFEDEDEQ